MGQPSARGTDIELAAASGPGFSGVAKGAPGRAYEVVLRWVDERILSGDLAVGDHLPAERELARQLEVGRSAVREAMRTLQAQGVVRSFVGHHGRAIGRPQPGASAARGSCELPGG